jgi:FMN phosphatase YigB (HAD superfamily)
MFVFFDIGETLASSVVSPNGRVEQLDVYPLIPEALDCLRGACGRGGTRVALGLMSNTGDETASSMRTLLEDAGLLALFEPDPFLFSSVEGLDKSPRTFLELVSERAEAAPGRCVFVGESEAERLLAASAGFQVSPHPLHALHLVQQQLSPQSSPPFGGQEDRDDN